MLRLLTAFQSRIVRDEEGAGMVEYALLVALIGVLLVAVLIALKDGIGTSLGGATTILNS
jgi:Flp pilus assembly pilin Flp